MSTHDKDTDKDTDKELARVSVRILDKEFMIA